MIGGLHVDWTRRSCRIDLSLVGVKPAWLEWSGVRHVHVALEGPWGQARDICVNDQWIDGARYVVELQTGDELIVEALTLGGALDERT